MWGPATRIGGQAARLSTLHHHLVLPRVLPSQSYLREMSAPKASMAKLHTLSPTLGQVTKRVYFLRHGQATHNPTAEQMRKDGCSFDEFLKQMQV